MGFDYFVFTSAEIFLNDRRQMATVNTYSQLVGVELATCEICYVRLNLFHWASIPHESQDLPRYAYCRQSSEP